MDLCKRFYKTKGICTITFGGILYTDKGVDMMREAIEAYWYATLHQDGDAMKSFFCNDGYVNWHNTNEHFTLEEYIRANCEYPGSWSGDLQRYIELEHEVITVVHVCSKERNESFHVTSFFRFSNDGMIESIDEYWGDDGMAPKWRLEKQIGSRITL